MYLSCNNYLSFKLKPSHNNNIKRNLIIVLSLRYQTLTNSYYFTRSQACERDYRSPGSSSSEQYFSLYSKQQPILPRLRPRHFLNNRLFTTSVNMSKKEETTDNNRIEKRELRKQIRLKMKEVTTEDITSQSEAVWKRLFNDIPQYKDAKSVGIFLSMPTGEIHTDSALHRILQDGKELYVPRVGENFEEADMDMVRVVHEGPHSHNDELFYKSWNKNKWGIPEPPHHPEKCTEAQPGDVDLLLVPGVAFDQMGGRLGQGKGYYDRFIARNNHLKKDGSTKMHLVAVGLRPQFLTEEKVPMSEHDFPMDALVSPDFIWTVEH